MSRDELVEGIFRKTRIGSVSSPLLGASVGNPLLSIKHVDVFHCLPPKQLVKRGLSTRNDPLSGCKRGATSGPEASSRNT